MFGGHLALRGPSLIEGNTGAGIRLVGSTAILNNFGGGTISVRRNGTTGDPLTAGISMTGSHLEGTQLLEVKENFSRGFLLQDDSTARIADVIVSDNAAEGVRTEGHSVIRIFAPATLKGNKTADVSCSKSSSGVGDASGIGKLSCADFEQVK
jgi:hypothetical protein